MQHGPLVGVFGVLGHLPVLVDPCGQYMGKNLDPSKEFVKAPGWLLAVDMLQPRVPTPPYPHTSLSVRGHLCSTQMNPPAPQLCRGCLVATWRGVNVWQLSLRHSLGSRSGEVLGSSSHTITVNLLQSVEIRAQTNPSVEQKGDFLLVTVSWT